MQKTKRAVSPSRTAPLASIPYGRHWLDDADVRAVHAVLGSDWLTQGQMVPAFEEAVALSCGTRYAVAFSSGTAALHAACFAAGISDGHEAVMSPITFAATANSVRYCGAWPVFADVDEGTVTLDPWAVTRAITSRTKAIMPVDFAGHPSRMSEFKRLADRHGLILIEDAAHALGATYDGRRVGQLADMTIFSFHPVKVLTTGEGGMVVTDRKDLYQRLQLFRNHGITRDPWLLRVSDPAPWVYEQHELGYNYRLTDIQAALGLSQLERLSFFIERRRAIAARYRAALADLKGLRLPVEREWAGSAWHLFVVRLDLPVLYRTRREVFEALRAKGIGVQVHYIPVYSHPYYQRFQRYQRCFSTCPRAERFYAEAISLPLFPKMTDEEVERVIGVVREVMHEAGHDRG